MRTKLLNKYVFGALLISAYSVTQANPITLAELDALNKEVSKDLQKGDYNNACNKLDKLNQPLIPNQTLFLIGKCKSALGETVTAIESYEEILSSEPNRLRVQLELAHQYFILGKLLEAKQLFNKVLKSSPPTKVRAKIMKHLEAIEQRYEWGGVVSIGYLHDSNVNSAPQNPNIEAFGLPFTLNSDSVENSDKAISTSLSLGRVFDGPFADLWRFDSYANLRNYRTQNLYDYNSLGVSISPQFFGKYNFNIPLGLSSSWENGKRASNSISLVPSISTEIKKGMSVNSRLTFNKSIDLRENSELDGVSRGLDIGTNYNLSRNSTIGLNLSRFINETSLLDYEQYQSNGITITYNHRLSNDISLSIQPSYSNSKYNSADPVDNGKKRSDTRKSLSINVWKPVSLSGLKITPVIGITHTQNDSNIKRRKHQRTQFNIQIRKEF